MGGLRAIDGSADDDAPIVELRHEAGLTAGQTLPLRPGRFRFGPQRSDDEGLTMGTPDVVSFDLHIDPDGEALLTAGAEPIAVEGVLVDQSARLGDGDVVQLTTDHFVLRSMTNDTDHRPERSIEPRVVTSADLPTLRAWLAIFGVVTVVGCIAGLSNGSWFGVALIGLGGLVATLAFRENRRRQAADQQATATVNARGLFSSEIIDARKAAAATLRAGANTPAVVAAGARGADLAGSHLEVTIASGDRAWTPPVTAHRRPGWDHEAIVEELSFLPAIPFTVDLGSGPLAILGPRAATLSVARHIATAVLVGGGPTAGVDVKTDVPADWRWLKQAGAGALRIVDHSSSDAGEPPIGPRTVVLRDTADELALACPGAHFPHVMTIADDGTASISSDADGGGSGFVPHGITDRHARDLQELISAPDDVIDLRDNDDRTTAVFSSATVRTSTHRPSDHSWTTAADPDRSNLLPESSLDTSRLLVTGFDPSKNKNLLATAALRQAASHSDHALYVLDRGDRALIRLAQLDTCIRYAALDQIDGVTTLVQELDDLTADDTSPRCLLLAPDLWATVDFYRTSGNRRLADRIDCMVSKMAEVPMAASSSPSHAPPHHSFLVWVETTHSDLAELQGPDESGLIELSSLPGLDLTGSIARLTATDKPATHP